jgi:hypothetical protein
MKRIITLQRRLLQTLSVWRGDEIMRKYVHAPQMGEIIRRNRAVVQKIHPWVPADLIKNSVFRYGVNPGLEETLDLPLDSECTHTDLLVYFGLQQPPCKYLELGVSVGKTFWQILNNCAPCECWGFDIEELTPVLKRQLVEQSREEWPSPVNSIKKTPSSITRYLHPESGGKVTYICADIFDEQAWELLAGANFNLVLSDALHTAAALEFEWAHLSRPGVLDPAKTVIMWDDLNGEMKTWFLDKRVTIARNLAIAPSNVSTVYLNGWLGRREFPHRLGLAIKTSSSGGSRR